MITVKVSGAYNPDFNSWVVQFVDAIGERYNDQPVVEVDNSLHLKIKVERFVPQPDDERFRVTIAGLAAEHRLDPEDIEATEVHGPGQEE